MNYPRSFELVKIAAFVLMLLDHVDMILLGGSQPWMHVVSRVAFPAFVFLFAFGCAFTKRPGHVALRLGAAAIVAQLLWWHLVPGYGFNVLVVMLLAALASFGREGEWWPAIAVFALYLAGVQVIEGGAVGFACIVAGLCAGRWWRGGGLLVARVAAVLDRGPMVRRAGPWLLWAYPGHLLALALLRWQLTS